MSILEQHNLTRVINARGAFTPLGVSRSSPEVCSAVAEALSYYFIMDELQDLVSKRIASFTGAQAATVTHCVASAITVSIAATMAGTSPETIASLPDSGGMPNCVVIPAGHDIDYGHPILQDIRLAGARPIVAGTQQQCSLGDIENQIENNHTCCLLLVSSRLVHSTAIDFAIAVKIAHSRGIPVIIDGAAQDFRIPELLQTGADLVLVSAQKYLASPTAGLVIGRKPLVDAVRAQEKGIGRGMKATKEAIIGVLCAIQERERLDFNEWKVQQIRKVKEFVSRADAFEGITARSEPDPTGLPFSRVYLSINSEQARCNANMMIAKLKSSSPSIWVMDQQASEDEIGLELVQITDPEIAIIFEKLSKILA